MRFSDRSGEPSLRTRFSKAEIYRKLRGLACEGLLLFAISTLVGCGTPTAVKKLSAEQTNIQVSYQQSLKSYFDLINRFADTQVTAANARIDQATRELESEYKAGAFDQLAAAKDDAGRRTVLSALANETQDNTASGEAAKAQIQALVAKLKSKNEEMLKAHQAMLEAQQKLNDYIQMKKADEALLDQLVGVLGVNRDKLDQSLAEIVTVTGEIERTVAQPKGGKTP